MNLSPTIARCKSQFAPKSSLELAQAQIADGQTLNRRIEPYAMPNAISTEIYRFMKVHYPDYEPAGFGLSHRVFAIKGGKCVIKVCFSFSQEDPQATANIKKHQVDPKSVFAKVAKPEHLSGTLFAELEDEYKIHRSPSVREILRKQGIVLPHFKGYRAFQYNSEILFYLKIYENIAGESRVPQWFDNCLKASKSVVEREGIIFNSHYPSSYKLHRLENQPSGEEITIPIHPQSHKTSAFQYATFYLGTLSLQSNSSLASKVLEETRGGGELYPGAFDSLV